MNLSRAMMVLFAAVTTGACASGGGEPFGGSFGLPQADDGGPNDTGSGTAGSGDDVPSTDGPMGTTAEGADASEGPASTGAAVCDPPCGAGDMCIDGVCFPADGTSGGVECHDGAGQYATCLGPGNAIDTTGCGGDMPTCINGGDPVIVGVCAQTDCVDECDCPAAPATGTAVSTCDAITGQANLCFLDCAGGQACPTSMVCFAELVCVWPGEGADGEPYGDCFNGGPSTCGLDGTCLTDDAMPSTVGVCTEACNADGDCPALPPGGTAPVSCQDVTMEGDNECVIDCSGGGTCPTGMTCFSDFLCMWN